jgi:hypothetical protein
MALVVFGFTYLTAAGIYALVAALAEGERERAFKAVSAGMLPPLGIIFGPPRTCGLVTLKSGAIAVRTGAQVSRVGKYQCVFL